MNELQEIALRIPRGMWEDLEATVIQQDRMFLSEVARSLGLPPGEVIRKCLGTGVSTKMVAVWQNPLDGTTLDACPWWECHGDGLWRRCPRKRLSPSLPCWNHERCTPCPLTRLHTDPYIQALPKMVPIKFRGALYWADPTNRYTTRNEDGSNCIEGSFLFTATRDGMQIVVWKPSSLTASPPTNGETPDNE